MVCTSKKRTVDCVVLPSSLEPDRKNLAVHVSLSSNLHNVKERTPVSALAGGVSGSFRFRISRTTISLRLPGSRPALSVVADQWEQLVLGVVSGRVLVETSKSVNTLFSTFGKAGNRNPKARISSFLSGTSAVVAGWPAPLHQRWAGYRGHPFRCQQPKMTKMTFLAERPGRRVEGTANRPFSGRFSGTTVSHRPGDCRF